MKLLLEQTNRIYAA